MTLHRSEGEIRARNSHSRAWPRSRVFEGVTVRKQPANSVPFGESISGNGKTVWVAYAPDGELVAIASTSAEVRTKYAKAMRDRG